MISRYFCPVKIKISRGGLKKIRNRISIFFPGLDGYPDLIQLDIGNVCLDILGSGWISLSTLLTSGILRTFTNIIDKNGLISLPPAHYTLHDII